MTGYLAQNNSIGQVAAALAILVAACSSAPPAASPATSDRPAIEVLDRSAPTSCAYGVVDRAQDVVDIDDVLHHLDEYHEKNVTVRGRLRFNIELCIIQKVDSKDKVVPGPRSIESTLWISLTSFQQKIDLYPCNGALVLLAGRIDKNRHGHVSGWPAAIVDVTGAVTP